MRQKYQLSKEGSENNLVIKEYAATDSIRHTHGAVQFEEDFTFLCQESYEGKDIRISISGGIGALIANLRTDNFFPVGLLAARIAQTVIELYRLSGDRYVELAFDDVEMFSHD